jgi:hypothetical protein
VSVFRWAKKHYYSVNTLPELAKRGGFCITSTYLLRPSEREKHLMRAYIGFEKQNISDDAFIGFD